MSSGAATAIDRLGRSLAGNRLPKPYQPPTPPQTTVNLSDPDTHLMKGHQHVRAGLQRPGGR